MSNRPFSDLKIKEIKNLVDDADDDTIKAIIKELGYRKSSPAKKLLEELKNKYSEFASETDASNQNSQTNNNQQKEYKKESKLDVSSGDVVQIFVNALEMELAVIRKEQSERSFILERGKKYDQSADKFYYEFRLDEDIGRLKENQPVTVVFNGKENSAEIVSLQDKIIRIATNEDIGDSLPSVEIKFDLAYLTERLKERLEKLINGEISFNKEMANKVLGDKDFEKKIENIKPSGLTNLNNDQETILGVSHGCEVSFLWGPPGTGKTHTLAEVIYSFYKDEKRVLLVSNTNSAIDLLIKSLSKGLDKTGDQKFKEGKVLRYKKIVDPELESEFGDYVNIEKVVERLSQALVEERNKLTKEKDKIDQKLSPLYKVSEAFKNLNNKVRKLDEVNDSLKKATENLSDSESKQKKLKQNIIELEEELSKSEKSSLLGKLIKRSPEKIKSDIDKAESKISSIQNDIDDFKKRKKNYQEELKNLNNQLDEIYKITKGKDENETKESIEKYEKELAPIVSRITEINNELSKLEEKIRNECLVLGSTAIQTFLKPDDFTNFDVVVIDEASMLRLPDVFYCSGLATKRVIIAGDFRQIPPIVQSWDVGVKKWLGEDIFSKAGIEDQVMQNKKPVNLVQLSTQYRMQKPIQELVNSIFYSGSLKTGSQSRFKRSIDLPEIFDNELVLIDTSKYRPFQNFKSRTGSKYNLYNTMVIRNLCLLFNELKVIEDVDDVGVITPYAAQNEILFKTFKELGLEDVESGTVHRFQGNEKNIIIFDIPESIPGERQIQENQTMITDNGISSDQAKLLNVAVTRARGLIILVCNKDFLLKNLNKQSILRSFINDFQKKGKVIDADKIIESGPEVDFKIPNTKKAKPNTDSVIWLDEKTFDDRFIDDVKKAKKWIIIYSGFCSINRLGIYSDLFKFKIKNGVKIRCVVPPSSDQSLTQESAQKCIDEMQRMGITVDLVGKIHDKTVLIDDDIVYFGSLNILSHTGNTGERMFRNIDKVFSETRSKFEIRNFQFLKDKTPAEYLSEKQNPDCGNCGALTVFNVPSRFNKKSGMYKCSLKCGYELWENEFVRNKTFGNKDDISTESNGELKPCPVNNCDGNLVLRSGRYGKFYGCTNYSKTKCKGRV